MILQNNVRSQDFSIVGSIRDTAITYDVAIKISADRSPKKLKIHVGIFQHPWVTPQGGGMILYVVDPEAVDTRYTAQWKKHLPLQLSKNTDEKIVVISGGETSRQQRPGLFQLWRNEHI